jgi:predicted acyltransferase
MAQSSVTKTSGRLLSLDVFRGATIAGMMLVNNPGSWGHIYPPFKHAAWHGWTYTDTVFPFFLWIVGVAMTFSMAKRMEQGADKNKLMLHVLQRAAAIIGIGLFLNAFPFGLVFGHNFSFETMRFPGVLQRIGFCYLISAMILLFSSITWQIRWTAMFLVGYWLLVRLVPVPGYGAGILEPMGNLAWYVDSSLLTGHTWRGAPVPGFDPEGIFSTIPAIATTMLGILTGHFVRSQSSTEDKTGWMFFWGSILILAGLTMDNWLPINKNLWTSSYTVFMAGLSLVVFACCYWVIDVKGYKRWTKPFEIYGLNAITMFALSGFIGRLIMLIKLPGPDGAEISFKTWYYQTFFVPLGDPMLASFLHSIAFMLGLYLIAYVMYRQKWVLKV